MTFDGLAPHYSWMELVLAGGLLQRCRTCWLDEVRDAKRVLLAGEGHGRMLYVCAAALPFCQITVLDQSERMLNESRRRWSQTQGHQNVVFKCADLLEWRCEAPGFDLIISNFLLDCFAAAELNRAVANLAVSLAPKGRWLLADFNIPPTGWRRTRARIILALAYTFFRYATAISAKHLVDPGPALGAAGLVLQRRKYFNQSLLRADLWVCEGNTTPH